MQWKPQAHLLLILFMASAVPVSAQDHDAGMINGRMWTFDQPPLEYFNVEYGFVPDDTWLEETRLAALRFGGGCSASFVSADGLVMTNYHCGIDAVGKVTREGENLLRDGFYATTVEDERRVPDLYVDQLVAMHDVTGEIIAAMAPATEAEQAFAARDKAINEITQRYSADGLHCEVVTFYSGARYSAYQYKRYEDVRLVLSTELVFAFFGGIYDFWSYPRYSFDCDFFRVYDNDKPLRTQHFYPWSRGGAAEEDAVFVVGNPGRTNRLTTVDVLAYERDKNVPNLVRLINDRKEVLETWLRAHPEESDAWFDELFGIVNAQEAYSGRLLGLRDDELMEMRADFDRTFQHALKRNPQEWEQYGDVWERIREVTQAQYEIADDLFALRTGGLGVSTLVTRATMLLNWLEQMSRADEDRDERYRGERGRIMGQTLTGPIGTPMELERMTLTRQLQRMQDLLGDDDAAVRLALAGETAEQAAVRLLSQTILADSVAMQDIVERQSLDGVDDVLIHLAGEMQPRFQA
ncbi:MAG: S46 family peptidase, partial [Bacteroidetes bacterium]|nr:S46 family peptidase [Bacteroidota bacterium]